MALVEPGRKAPAFALPDQDGKTHRLRDYAGRPLILYFYPKDDTPGCTREACAFRDALPDFKKGRAAVLGVSVLDAASKARFARKPTGQKKIGIWKWKENPFVGTREFNGLRVMMAVMNSWDLKDINNAVFADSRSGRDLFLMSDVGATFGTNGLSWTNARSKGNVDSFKDSKFISKTTRTTKWHAHSSTGSEACWQSSSLAAAVARSASCDDFV